jgi:hypothetical protein
LTSIFAWGASRIRAPIAPRGSRAAPADGGGEKPERPPFLFLKIE